MLGKPCHDVRVSFPVTSQAEADAMAKAALNAKAREFVSADGICSGNARMFPGEIVELEGLGEQFSGRYLISRVQHVATTQGFTTEFSVERTSLGQAAETATQAAPPLPRRKGPGSAIPPKEVSDKALVNAHWSTAKVREREVVTSRRMEGRRHHAPRL